MTDFTIILNSRDTTSWIGTDIYNCYYYIDLSSLLDYNFDFTKNYKVSFSFKGSQSLIIVGNVIGVYLNNISNSMKTQNNLLGLLNTKLLDGGLTADVLTKEEDNPSVYLTNINNTSILTLNVKRLIQQTTNTRTYFLTDLLYWYRFFLSDAPAIPNYVSGGLAATLQGNAQILEDQVVTFGTVPSFLTLPNFDFTPYVDTPLTISVWIKTSQTSQFTLFVLTGASVFQFRIVPGTGSRCLWQYGGNLVLEYTQAENNNTFNLGDNCWNLVTLIFGNIPEHKLYLNGILVKTATNTVTNLTGIKTNFLVGMNTASVNNFFGEASDFRFYARELAAVKIRDYWYNNPLSKNPNYQANLHFQEV